MRLLDTYRSGDPAAGDDVGNAVPGGRTGNAPAARIVSPPGESEPFVEAPFGHALAALAARDERVVGMTADLGKYTDLNVFAQSFPDRFIQMGMAEQALISAAAGLAREGFVPFATTYAAFAARRAYDFVANAVAEPRLPVKIVCALPGLTSGHGPSHQSPDDLAIFRVLPNMTVIDPCDADEIAEMVPALAAHEGPVYARLLRGRVPAVLRRYRPDYRFEIGKAHVLRPGADVLMISTGLMTMRALEAAERLAADRIDVSVLHVPTIKPLDLDRILGETRCSDRLVVTAENHSRIGGLGEAVATALLMDGQTPTLRMIGLPDAFLASGTLPVLHDRYRLSTDRVAEDIKGWLSRHPIFDDRFSV